MGGFEILQPREGVSEGEARESRGGVCAGEGAGVSEEAGVQRGGREEAWRRQGCREEAGVQ